MPNAPKAQETASSLFRARQLGPAIAAANAEVRRTPGDLGARVLLAELLLFAGTIERADTILDAAATADPTAAVVVAEFRQLLRAETARRQLARDGRVPEFLDDLRLGHSTEWSEEESGPVRGSGQRVFLAGDDALGIMDIAELRFGT